MVIIDINVDKWTLTSYKKSIRPKSATAVAVTRATVERCLDEHFTRHTRVLTGRSLKHAAHSSKLALIATEANVNWAAKLSVRRPSTATDVIAVAKGMTYLLSMPSHCSYVIPCGSWCAISRLTSPSTGDIAIISEQPAERSGTQRQQTCKFSPFLAQGVS